MLWVVHELFKKLPFVCVPPALEPCGAARRRQLLQFPQVLWLRLHKRLVVLYLRLNEKVIIRVLIVVEVPVDKHPLEIRMPRAAGVQRIIRPLWKSVRSSHASIDRIDPRFLHLPGLVQEYHVVFCALVLSDVAFLCAVAEGDLRTVRECEFLVRLVVLRNPMQHPLQRRNVVVLQLLVCPSDDQHLDAGILAGKQNRLHAHSPALPTAAGAAVGDMPVLVFQEKHLLRLRGSKIQRLHSLDSSASFSSRIRVPPVSCFSSPASLRYRNPYSSANCAPR